MANLKKTRYACQCLGACSIAAALAFTASSAQAQSETPAVSSTGSGLGDIIVTARKQSERLQDVPVAVSAVSDQTLSELNITQADKLASLAPNLNIISGAGASTSATVFIRGIGIMDSGLLTNENPVGIYVDGVYVARASMALTDMVDVERVEVLRGPQGTLFGRNTTGGSIQIFTKTPSHDLGFSQKLGYGTDNDFISTSILNTGDIGPSGIRGKFIFSHHQRDGYIHNTRNGSKKSDDPGSFERQTIISNIEADLSESVSLNYKFDYFKEKGFSPALQMSSITPALEAYFGRSPHFGGDPLVYSPDRLKEFPIYNIAGGEWRKFLGHSLTALFDINDALQIKSISAYRDNKSSLHPNNTGVGLLKGPVFDPATGITSIETVAPSLVLCCNTPTQKQWSQEFQANGSLGDFDFTSGLYYFREKVADSNHLFTTTVNAATLIGVNSIFHNLFSGKSESWAAYGQASYLPSSLDGRLELTGGLRYTEDKKWLNQNDTLQVGSGPFLPANVRDVHAKFDNVSWLASIRYKWSDAVMTYARASTAYKAGGFNPRDAAGSTAPFDAENAISYEAGLKSDLFDRRLRINATAFYTKVEDLQVTQFAPVLGVAASITTNAGKAEYKGVEFEVVAIPVEGLELSGSLGYVEPKYKEYLFFDRVANQLIDVADEAHFPYVAKTTYNLAARYELPDLGIGKLSARANYNYLSARVFNALDRLSPNNHFVRSPAQHNLSASINLVDIPVSDAFNLSVSVYGENLLNQKQRVAAIDRGVTSVIVFGRMRSFGINVNAEF